MTSNPVPTNKNISFTVKASGSTAVKRDINLISNREAQSKMAKRSLFVLLGLVLLLGFGFFGFYLPWQAGKLLEYGYQDANSQLSAYADTDAQFNSLSAQTRTLKAMVDSLNSTDSQKKSAYDILTMIEKASPANILYTDIEYSINEVKLTGLADKDSDVAQLVVNLQTYPQFYKVNVQEVAPNEVTVDPAATAQTEIAKKKRQFTVVAQFPEPATTQPSPEPAATAQSNGGSGS